MDSAFFISLCLFMFLGTFLSGYVPIFFASLGGCSAKRLRFISAVGVGVLIGTALSIIIPEGVHKLYQASIIRHSVLSSDMHDNSEDILNSSPCHFDEDNLKYIGMALSGGFVFMLLIEFITTGLVGHGHSHSTHSTTSNNYEENGLSLGEKEKLSQSNFRTKGRICCRCSSSSTIGLLIHCAIDGIAMGSVGSSQSGAQEFMVFLALFLHKAPSAFGLSSLLLQQRSHLKDVIRQLLIFSITSPIFGIITFFIFRTKEAFELVDSSRVAEEIRHQTNLAICLLFSAGTFLFVATVHALPEIRSSMKNEESDIPGTNVHQGLHWAEVSAIALGILLPAFVNIDAAHGH